MTDLMWCLSTLSRVRSQSRYLKLQYVLVCVCMRQLREVNFIPRTVGTHTQHTHFSNRPRSKLWERCYSTMQTLVLIFILPRDWSSVCSVSSAAGALCSFRLCHTIESNSCVLNRNREQIRLSLERERVYFKRFTIHSCIAYQEWGLSYSCPLCQSWTQAETNMPGLHLQMTEGSKWAEKKHAGISAVSRQVFILLKTRSFSQFSKE